MNRRPVIHSAVLRRSLHVARFVAEALAFSVVISAVMLAWILFE